MRTGDTSCLSASPLVNHPDQLRHFVSRGSSGHLRTWDSVPGPRTNSGLAYADRKAGRFVWLKSKFFIRLTAGCRGDGILLTVRWSFSAVSNNKNERFQPYYIEKRTSSIQHLINCTSSGVSRGSSLWLPRVQRGSHGDTQCLQASFFFLPRRSRVHYSTADSASLLMKS